MRHLVKKGGPGRGDSRLKVRTALCCHLLPIMPLALAPSLCLPSALPAHLPA